VNKRIDVVQRLRRIMVLRIGIAMLQGARDEHASAIDSAAKEMALDVDIVELRDSHDISNLDALVLPGGESTTMRLASKYRGLLEGIFEWIESNPESPVMGTCAGAILLCQPGDGREPFLNAEISRNSFGRQVDSFQAGLNVELDGESSDYPGVFIRAPRFESNDELAVAYLNDEVVGLTKGNRMALTFHPELTEDLRFHRWLLKRANEGAVN
jgi:5'-phosphate synthase pdxT subunit